MNQVRVLSMALVVSLGAMGFWVYKTKQNQWVAEQRLVDREKEFATEIAMQQKTLADRMSQKDLELQARLSEQNVEFEKRQQERKAEEKKRLSLAMDQFAKMLEGNQSTSSMVNSLEAKVKAGQAISEAEAEQLQVLVSAFTHLQKQYQKPLKEFAELEKFLARESDTDLTTPNMKNAFWKRMFSKNFRAQERDFYRNEGERQAYQNASEAFDAAYARAQRQMGALQKDFQGITDRLAKALENRDKPENLAPIFQQIRKGLEIHQEVIEFEPDLPKELNDGVRP